MTQPQEVSGSHAGSARDGVRGVVGPRTAIGTALGVGAVGLVADLLTKAWAVSALEPETPVPVVGDLLRFYLIRNSGAAFSLGNGHTWVFTVLAALVLVGLLVGVVPRLRHRGWAVGIGLVLAGIGGNLIDRLMRPPGFGRGHVVDFLQLPHWPIFNVADICVTGGALACLLVMFRSGVGFDGRPEAEPRHRGAKRGGGTRAPESGDVQR